MKFSVVFFVFIMASIGFASLEICTYNSRGGTLKTFDSIEKMKEANSQGGSKYFEYDRILTKPLIKFPFL